MAERTISALKEHHLCADALYLLVVLVAVDTSPSLAALMSSLLSFDLDGVGHYQDLFSLFVVVVSFLSEARFGQSRWAANREPSRGPGVPGLFSNQMQSVCLHKR